MVLFKLIQRGAIALFCFAALNGPVQAQDEVPDLKARIDRLKAHSNFEDELTDTERKVIENGLKIIEEKLDNPGLEVGAKAPDFTLPNVDGKDVRFYDILEKGPVVLTFYRGSWCPYCNLELYALRESIPTLEKYGATLVAVTPQKTEFSKQQAEKDKFDFELLSDLDSSVMKSYNLFYEVPAELNKLYLERFEFDLAEYNGEGRYVLPVPGTFVIGKDGIVAAAYADVDYTKRMQPTDIVSALQGL